MIFIYSQYCTLPSSLPRLLPHPLPYMVATPLPSISLATMGIRLTRSSQALFEQVPGVIIFILYTHHPRFLASLPPLLHLLHTSK